MSEDLGAAEQAASEENFDLALEHLQSASGVRNLTSHEKSQIHTAYGFVYFSQGQYAKSVESYRRVLAEPDTPEAMRTSTKYTIAQLLFQMEDYEGSIAGLEEWLQEALNPGPEAYALIGQAYYLLERYEEGIAPVEKAIEIARARERKVEENWYLLLRLFYSEAGNYAKVLEILERLLKEYPKKDYWIHLASVYGETDRSAEQLAVLELAELQGFLTQQQELIVYAQLLLEQGVPYRAGRILESGMDSGVIEPTETNLRLLSQAWTSSRDGDKAIDALTQAAELSDDGELDARLAFAYANVEKWDLVIASANTALDKKVTRSDQMHLLLGMAHFERDNFGDAKSAFRKAQTSDESKRNASQWLQFIESEEKRLAELRRTSVQ